METVRKSSPNLAFGRQPGVLQRTQILLDFSQMERKGIIQIKPKKMVVHKEAGLQFRSFKAQKVFYDAKAYNVTCGIPIEAYDNGTFKFQQIKLTERTMYNLENELDAQKWHVVRHLDEVEGSPNLIGEPKWLIHNEDKIAEEGISKTEKTIEAWDYIRSLSESKISSVGRIFGRNPATESPQVIKNYMLQLAAKEPEKIINTFANLELLSLQEVFYRALAVGVIKHTIDRGYVTARGVSLGSTPLAVCEALRKDVTLLNVINFESIQLDKNYQQEEGEEDQVTQMANEKLFGKKNGQGSKKKPESGIIDKTKKTTTAKASTSKASAPAVKPATEQAPAPTGQAAGSDEDADDDDF